MKLLLPFVVGAGWLGADAALAQPSGSISGAVLSEGQRVPGAPIQAIHRDSGRAFRTLSSEQGEYVLELLPAGSYDLSLTMPGFGYKPYGQSDLRLRDGEVRRHDITLAGGYGLGTVGDDAFTYLSDIRALSKELTGPVPRMADGRPDLSGVWNGNDDLYPEDPALKPWAVEVLRKHIANDFRDLPGGFCLPSGVIPNGPFFRKFVQTRDLLVVLTEDDVIGYRQIFMDGRDPPADLEPTWQGHAIGHWEGDTLVVDVTGFNEKSIMGIFPHTEQLRITERYRRRDFGHMEVQVVAEDPGTLTKPWTTNMVWDLAPDQDLREYVCTESTLNMHLDWRELAGL